MHAFHDDGSATCQWHNDISLNKGYYVAGSAQNCDAVAGIQFPNGVTVKSLSCYVFDSTSTDSIVLELKRFSIVTRTITTLFTTPSSGNGGFQNIKDTTGPATTAVVVDNTQAAYLITANFTTGTDVSSTNLALYGCTVTY